MALGAPAFYVSSSSPMLLVGLVVPERSRWRRSRKGKRRKVRGSVKGQEGDRGEQMSRFSRLEFQSHESRYRWV
jgi:hypothetical protein